MAVPVSQMYTVAKYVLTQKLKGVKRYPLVLMLEPLFRCNLACAGCGKIQYPDHVLDKRLTPEQCWAAAEECGAPIVAIPGGEPLIHPEIGRIVEGLVAQRRYIYVCTNAILLERKLKEFSPSKYLTFSVHMDGLKREHDLAVCRDGVYEVAVRAIKEALNRGHRVTTNTTLFDDANPDRVRQFFDEMMALGVEGMMISPGYSYQKAPDQQHFLKKAKTRELFSKILSRPKRSWKFNQSPLFLDFLHGNQRIPVHALGESDVQRLRLAEALLSPSGRVYEDVSRTDGSHRVAKLRHEQEREVRRMHGALRLRGFRGRRHLRKRLGIRPHGENHAAADRTMRSRWQTACREWHGHKGALHSSHRP